MKARILPTSDLPLPWGEPPRAWPVLNRPARQWTAEALHAAGVERVEQTDGEHLLLPDNLLLSAEFLRDFLALAQTRPADRDLCAALGPGLLATGSAGRSLLPPGPDGSLPVPLLLVRAASPVPMDLDGLIVACERAESVVVDLQEKVQEVPVPKVYAEEGKDTRAVGGTVRIAMHLRHRTALLHANLTLLSATLLRIAGRNKVLLALRYLWERYLRPGPRRLFSQIGRGCTIHPTAIVEFSQLGENVEIGAYAIVRGAVLGDGAAIEDAAQVQISVLGPGVRVARQCYVFCCVLQEGAHQAAPIIQFTTLGRHSATTSFTHLLDVVFGRNVRVEDRGGYVDSGFAVLGCDVGHGTVVGAEVTTAPGRMLPSNAIIVGEPRQLMSAYDERLRPGGGAADPIDFADAGGQTLAVRDGKLEPLT